MAIAKVVSSRSTCLRRKVGAVAVNSNHRVLGTGYNGAPRGMSHCTKETCVRSIHNIPSGKSLDVCRAIHAEGNIILQLGDKLNDATLYVTVAPCISCLKLLIGCGIKEIIWKGDYPDNYSKQFMEEYGDVSQSKNFFTLQRR